MPIQHTFDSPVSVLTNEIFYKKLALEYAYHNSILVESGLAYDGNTYNDFYDGNEKFVYPSPVTTAAAPFSVKESKYYVQTGNGNPIGDTVDEAQVNVAIHYLITNLNQKPIHQIYVDGSTPTEKAMAYLEAYAESSMNSVLIERDKMLFRLLFSRRTYYHDNIYGEEVESDSPSLGTDCYAIYEQKTDLTSATISRQEKAIALMREIDTCGSMNPKSYGASGPYYFLSLQSFIKEYFYNIMYMKHIFEDFKGTVHADGTIGMTNMFTACNFTFVGVPDEVLNVDSRLFYDGTTQPGWDSSTHLPALIAKRDAVVFSVPKINKKGMSINGQPVPNLRTFSTPSQSKNYNSEDKKIYDALTKKFMDSDLASRNNPRQFGLNTLLLSMESLGSSYSIDTNNHTGKGLYLQYKTYCTSGRQAPKTCILFKIPRAKMETKLAVYPEPTPPPLSYEMTQGKIVDGLKPGGQGEFTYENGETEVIKKDEYGKTKSHSKHGMGG